MYATTPLRAEPKLIFGSWLGWLSSLPTLNFVVVLSNRRSRQSSIKMENCGFIFLYKFLQRAFFHMHTHPTTSTHPSIHPFGSVNSFARELRAHRTKQTRLRDYRTALRVLVDSHTSYHTLPICSTDSACIILLEIMSAQYQINMVGRLPLYSCFSLGSPYLTSGG